jgi:hypothetical protein
VAASVTGSAPQILDALDRHVRLARSTPFELGRMDCSLWVADWVSMRTGVDLAADLRGRYKTRAEVLRLIIPLGNLVRIAARRLDSIGAAVIDPAQAQPGDIGIVATTDGPALALFADGAWQTKTGDPLFSTPTASFAWRLP